MSVVECLGEVGTWCPGDLHVAVFLEAPGGRQVVVHAWAPGVERAVLNATAYAHELRLGRWTAVGWGRLDDETEEQTA